MKAIANFNGVDGSRFLLLSHGHSHAKKKLNTTTQAGGKKLFTANAGKPTPPTIISTLRIANKLSDPAFCS